MMKTEKYIYEPLDTEIHYTHGFSTTNASFPYHRHNAYELYLFISGNINYYLEHSCYHLQPGDLLVINPREMHRLVCLDNQIYERIYINLKKSYLNRLSSALTNLSLCFDARPLGKNNLIHLSAEQMNQYIELADQIGTAMHSNSYGSDILIDANLIKLLLLVNTAYQSTIFSGTNIMPDLIQKTMNYVERNLSNSITLDKISNEFFLSGPYISKQFKNHTGLTLRSYITDRRIFLAKTLLDEGESVTNACLMSGFSDYANFIRSFTNSVGISPGKYSKRRFSNNR